MVPHSNHLGLDDLVSRDRRVRHLRVDPLQCRQDLKPLDHAAKDRVLAIQVGGRTESDEELGGAGIGALVRHAKCAAKVLPRLRLGELAVNLLSS